MVRVLEVQFEAPSHLRLQFSDGFVGVVDIGYMIRNGGVFSALQDPAFAQQVRVGMNGLSVEWPGEIDLGAESLRASAVAVQRKAS
ncbi:MAG: DUF2442 domain-containing protein [Phycisphaerales bacterium]